MQNTEKGQEKHCKWLRGKGQSTKHYKVQYDAQARQKTTSQLMAVNSKLLARVKCDVKLQ